MSGAGATVEPVTAADLPTPRDRGIAAARAGIRDALLVVIAYIPFALASGVVLAATDLGPVLAILTSPVIFAGASQLVAAQLLDAGAGITLVVVTVLVVNARHLLYSAALAPHLADWSRGSRMLGAFLLADPVYGLAAARFERREGGGIRAERMGYYFGAGFTCLLGWTTLTSIGILAGGLVPAWVPLELAVPLTFLLLTLPLIKDSAGAVAAAVGGVVALAGNGLPLGVGIMLGSVAGIAAGAIVVARGGRGTPDAPDAPGPIGPEAADA